MGRLTIFRVKDKKQWRGRGAYSPPPMGERVTNFGQANYGQAYYVYYLWYTTRDIEYTIHQAILILIFLLLWGSIIIQTFFNINLSEKFKFWLAREFFFIHNKKFERSRIFRYGLPKDFLSDGRKTKGGVFCPLVKKSSGHPYPTFLDFS